MVVATSQEHDEKLLEAEGDPEAKDQMARRLALRKNTKRVLQESGLAEMLQGINKNLLKWRGRIEEYDTMLLLRWGTLTTRRHMWIEIIDDTIRFRLQEHRRCAKSAPECDGEYHSFTKEMWSDRAFFQAELKKYYDRPVAETSSD
ncbi:hypothetical protein EPA93_41480 [Ktedonosporobacter rubrisoli]|uniref:Uncharacterized protein n=1 Tax=Ktedonosporobacter rubrisoli TaxID=2509675 RepID=A0A4P6K304_KTERU|nr:hypothetical protein [Ktedonosporobacter rubrisoli]QBD82110.1 hypothetical protein EPA93_41480 [Ktedonosporobacter rubrisoli]